MQESTDQSNSEYGHFSRSVLEHGFSLSDSNEIWTNNHLVRQRI